MNKDYSAIVRKCNKYTTSLLSQLPNEEAKLAKSCFDIAYNYACSITKIKHEQLFNLYYLGTDYSIEDVIYQRTVANRQYAKFNDFVKEAHGIGEISIEQFSTLDLEYIIRDLLVSLRNFSAEAELHTRLICDYHSFKAILNNSTLDSVRHAFGFDDGMYNEKDELTLRFAYKEIESIKHFHFLALVESEFYYNSLLETLSPYETIISNSNIVINAPKSATHYDMTTSCYIEQDLALRNPRAISDIKRILELEQASGSYEPNLTSSESERGEL